MPRDVGDDRLHRAERRDRVIPGSHKWEDKLRPHYEETVPGRDAEGLGLLLCRLRVPRRRREPLRASARLGINVGYTLSWLRQEENQYLACPPERRPHDRRGPREAHRVPARRTRRYFGDLQDPMEAARPSNT